MEEREERMRKFTEVFQKRQEEKKRKNEERERHRQSFAEQARRTRMLSQFRERLLKSMATLNLSSNEATKKGIMALQSINVGTASLDLSRHMETLEAMGIIYRETVQNCMHDMDDSKGVEEEVVEMDVKEEGNKAKGNEDLGVLTEYTEMGNNKQDTVENRFNDLESLHSFLISDHRIFGDGKQYTGYY